MARDHIHFWADLAGKLGPPIFAGTLVACLLSGALAADHLVLMAVGLGLTGLGHWWSYHRH